jgi:hypothetical protein
MMKSSARRFSVRSLRKRKTDVHLCGHFDSFSLLQIRLVFPLLRRVNRSGNQSRVSAHNLQIFDIALLSDNRIKNHSSCNVRLERWLSGLPEQLFSKSVGSLPPRKQELARRAEIGLRSVWRCDR